MLQANFQNLMPLMQNMQHILQKNMETEQKLSDIMHELAHFFNANMSALYVAVEANYLELFSNDGFDIDDIPTNVRFGEGLIGEIATQEQILSQTQPNKSCVSMVGAPLMLWDKVSGVVVLGYTQKHLFDEMEIDTLKTISMFLATFFSSEEISNYKRKLAKSRGFNIKDRLKGLPLSKGYGVGAALVHMRRHAVRELFTQNIAQELTLLETARTQMIESLNTSFNQNVLNAGEHIEILQTYQMLANDKGWYQKISAYIKTGLTAEAAIEKTYDDMREKLSLSSDIYLKERLNDLRDISDRLRSFISGDYLKKDKTLKDFVLVAQNMGPADLMDYDPKHIRALILEDGTSTMHVSIVAKALNIPVVSKIKGLYKNVKDGEILAVDGTEGFVYINPPDEIKKNFEERQKKISDWRTDLKQISLKPSKTRDGKNISLNMNIGLDFDLEYFKLANCDGIGLYRTEIPFMSALKMPGVSEQVRIYKKVLNQARDKHVIFRSLDVGSDKLLPYWGDLKEENPAIGWRSIRITLDRRALLRSQMKAFLKSCAGRQLDVMFPMISSYNEFIEAKNTLLLEYEKQRQNGNMLPTKLNIGLMIEVPSVIFELDEILKEADFISVGTNDLAQFIFASDRTNPRLENRYDVLSAPFLKVMQSIIIKANQYHVPCSVCGEMASVPVEIIALLGLGYRIFSCTGSAFTAIKKTVRSTHINDLRDYVQHLLRSNKKTLRPQLVAYAYDHGIAI